MRCIVIFRERVATFILKKMSFLPELQPGRILLIGIPTSFSIPGGFLTLILSSEWKS
jgi:hypothetical protein